MDVMRLIDRLESLVNTGTRIPMSSRAIVDEQEFLDLVDQIRVAFPEELKQARRLSQEREKVLSQAQVEAEKLLSDAREQVAALLANDEVVVLAKRQADDILNEARAEAADVRNDADSYAIEMLSRLESELERLAAQARKGRALLQQSRQESEWSGSLASDASMPDNGAERYVDVPPANRRP